MNWIVRNIGHFEAPMAILLGGFAMLGGAYGRRLGDKEKLFKLVGMGLIVVSCVLLGIAVSRFR